jgi:hypothetical protein
VKILNDAYALYKMALQLRSDTLGIIDSGHYRNSSPTIYISLYNDIRKHLLQVFNESVIVKSLPCINPNNYSSFYDNYKSGYIDVLSAVGQEISFLEGALDAPDKKIEKLKDEIKSIREDNLKLEETNRLNAESLNRFIRAEEFPISEKILGKIPKDISPTLHDALCAYGAGSYSASVCVCRNIIQGLVQELCAKNDIKENGLNNQIDALVSRKIIKQKHNQTLLDTVATLGHRSAHPTTEVFTKEKASLVLNGLLILIDEVFS